MGLCGYLITALLTNPIITVHQTVLMEVSLVPHRLMIPVVSSCDSPMTVQDTGIELSLEWTFCLSPSDSWTPLPGTLRVRSSLLARARMPFGCRRGQNLSSWVIQQHFPTVLQDPNCHQIETTRNISEDYMDSKVWAQSFVFLHKVLSGVSGPLVV